MTHSKFFAFTLCLASVLPVAAFACTADQMAGSWKCGGGYKACIAGHDVSRVFQASDGSMRLQDGLGYEAQLTVDGDDLTARYLDGPRAGGEPLKATLDSDCRKIAWSDTHADTKF
jgi:hypothetical protein